MLPLLSPNYHHPSGDIQYDNLVSLMLLQDVTHAHATSYGESR